MNDYVDKLWNSDAVACLDALKEADEAVETINRDMFSIIADVAADIVADGSNDNHSAVLKDTLKEFEKKYKKERSLKHMPGSYRSAKSAIVNAVRHGISLTDPIDGKTKGKSALEKEIKQATKKQADEKPVKEREADDMVHRLLTQAETSLDGLYPSRFATNMDPSEIRESLSLIEKHIEGIRHAYGV